MVHKIHKGLTIYGVGHLDTWGKIDAVYSNVISIALIY